MADSLNPFAPPTSAIERPSFDALPEPGPKSRGWLLSFALWALVCIVSAAPSFYWGFGTIATNQAAAMCLGIAMFIAAYTLCDQLTQRRSWRQQSSVSLTLRIGYVSRIMASIIFPIGMFVDAFCGMFSVGIVQSVFPFLFSNEGGAGAFDEQAGFAGTLLVTLVQGCVLNIVLFAYMLVVLGVVVLLRRFWQSSEQSRTSH